MRYFLLAFILFITYSIATHAQPVPKEWVDPDTGHRVIRLSPDAGGESLYFHYNGYSADGQKLVFATSGGISAVDLKTHEVSQIVAQGTILESGRKTNEVFYTVRGGGAVMAANLDTKAVREVIKLPAGRNVTCINSDQTLFAGTTNATDPTGNTPRPAPRVMQPQAQRMFPGRTLDQLTPEERTAAQKEDGLAQRLANPASMALFTLNAQTGEVKTFGYAYAWLNHLQFSPTDPSMLMFCHEGTWHEVDRVWTIKTDGTQPAKLMHARTMDMEIAGHEFWARDGKTLWFDLQTPRSQVFWIAGVELATGKETKYKVERDWWSVHYNVSPDGKFFSGDGGDPGQVAFAKDGQWMNLFRPQPDGTLQREKLVNMAKHNYRLEPNATITPDNKWVVFRSNMLGNVTHVYAVEMALP